MMLLDVYNRAKDAAEHVTNLSGDPLKSACEIGHATRSIPGLAEFIKSAQSQMVQDLQKIVLAYRYGDVTDAESRKFATSLENAPPYLGTFISHPGMSGNTNGVELTIRGRRVVRQRNIQRILPDWQSGARTLEMLQTIHATCANRGIFSGDMVAGRRGSWNLDLGTSCMPLNHTKNGNDDDNQILDSGKSPPPKQK